MESTKFLPHLVLAGLLALYVCRQRSQDGSFQFMGVAHGVLHAKSRFHEVGVKLSRQETMAFHHQLVEGDVRFHAHDAILFQSAPHA